MDVRLTEKYLFDRQKAFEVCCAYYRERGYDEDHCKAYVGQLEDWRLKEVYEIICKEKYDAGEKRDNLL